MGPKKGKDDANTWRKTIETATIDDETFKVKVIIMECADGNHDKIYLDKFEVFAAEERRYVVKNICKSETIFMVNQLGEEKGKDQSVRVFEEGLAFLRDKKDIPPDLLALIIKHLILKMKDEYFIVKRNQSKVQEGMRRESATMIGKAEVRGTVFVKPPEPAAPIPQPTGKGKKNDSNDVSRIPEPEEGKKYNTQLRVRGEDWRDKIYVDDFPLDGPNIYVALTGFQDSLLPACLVKIGIPLTAIVQIRINPTTAKIPSSLSRPTKRGQSQTEIFAQNALKFWETLQSLRINPETADDYKNIAFFIYTPPYSESEVLSGDSDKIYDELCYLMYDVQDLSRQHLHYLENMDITYIPEETVDNQYSKFYQKLIEDIPLECVTVYSVLENILQTVSQKRELDEQSSKSSFVLPNNNKAFTNQTDKAESLVKKALHTLCSADKNKKKYRPTYGEDYENFIRPIVMNFGDLARYVTFHVGNINLHNIIWSMLVGMPIITLWSKQWKPIDEYETKLMFHVSVLLSCFERDDVETAEFERLFHLLACRKLYNNRSSLKKREETSTTITQLKKNFLKRSILAEPLPKSSAIFTSFASISRHPSIITSENSSGSSETESDRVKFLFECPDISELVSATEIANKIPVSSHFIDNYEYFEDFEGITALQVIHDAYNNYNCVNYKYCEVTDCFILIFFNSHNENGIANEEWRSHLDTPVCLQDFFDYVLEENIDWIENEEKIYDEQQLKQKSSSKSLTDHAALASCLENTDIGHELLMEGSLKHQDLMELVGETSSLASYTKDSSTGRSTMPQNTDSTRSGKETKMPLTSTPKSKHQSLLQNEPESPLVLIEKPFLGYNLGDRRVEAFGKDCKYYSKDGTVISSSYTLMIPSNLEYLVVKITPGNGYNQFWLHRSLATNLPAEIQNNCESFRISCKDQMLINIVKQTYEVPLHPSDANIPLTSKQSIEIKPELINDTKYYHSVVVTWPNGLITESVHLKNSNVLSHIKQFYVSNSSALDEDMRCINLNGEVIIFKKSGYIDVLRPDGTYITITNCEKRKVPGAPLGSEVSFDKSKKGKTKGKSKISIGKSPLEENIEKPIEYELVIDEFEIIETSGLRQRWIKDMPFTIEKLLIRTATDYNLGEIYSRRMDGTRFLLNKDGIQTVTFPDGTRIISQYVVQDEEIYPEWTDEEIEYYFMLDSNYVEAESINIKSRVSFSQRTSNINCNNTESSTSRKCLEEEETETPAIKTRTDGYIFVDLIFTVEHSRLSTVSINTADKKVCIDSPNGTSIEMDLDNNYDFTFNDQTWAHFDGENLKIIYEACVDCHSTTTCDVKIMRAETSSVTKFHQTLLNMKDSCCTKVVMNEEGSINVLGTSCSNINVEMDSTGDIPESESNTEVNYAHSTHTGSFSSHAKCKEISNASSYRFFVFRRDLTCSEVVHRSLVQDYKRNNQWRPWCTMETYDIFGDNRLLHSIVAPVYITESEKWLMESKFASKPKNLTYKDLKEDCGKGFYHWMRPYGRFVPVSIKPPNVLPMKFPKAFILRTLEQQWDDDKREDFIGGKELLRAILRYRDVMEKDCATMLNIPLRDCRTELEKNRHDTEQNIAHKLYNLLNDLGEKLKSEVENSSKKTITTKPPKQFEWSYEAEGEEEAEQLEETEAKAQLQELEEVTPINPALKRYWNKREEEYKEEQFYRYLLRDCSVPPPYFRNVLGGAFWWELNYVAGEAVTKAERNPMRCRCNEEEDTSKKVDEESRRFI